MAVRNIPRNHSAVFNHEPPVEGEQDSPRRIQGKAARLEVYDAIEGPADRFIRKTSPRKKTTTKSTPVPVKPDKRTIITRLFGRRRREKDSVWAEHNKPVDP